MAQNLHQIECTLAIFQQSGPKLVWPYMRSTSFLPTWPQFSIISHALQQFFVKLAQNNWTLPCRGERPYPHSDIFLAYWPILFNDGMHFQWFTSQWSKPYPPLRQFLGILAQLFPWYHAHSNNTLPPLGQCLGILAQLFSWCHAHYDIFSTKRPMHPENHHPH